MLRPVLLLLCHAAALAGAAHRGAWGAKQDVTSGAAAEPEQQNPQPRLSAATATAAAAAAAPPATSPFPSFVPSCSLQGEVLPRRVVLKRWSNPATWGLPTGSAVPGVGSLRGSNATVPCGLYVLLDTPDIHLHTLTINGYLTVDDPATPAVFQVQACFVVVRGQLVVGSSSRQFRSRIVFTLLPNPGGRLPLVLPSPTPQGSTTTINLGHKAFAVVGGQVHLHGLPRSPSTPSWTVLNATAEAGDSALVLAEDVSAAWPVGSLIAVASSDYTPLHSEWNVVTGYRRHEQGTLVLLRDQLQYRHYGDKFGVPDGWGGHVDERAEVGLLSRQIVIQGQGEAAPYDLEGGHLVVFMTATPQFIEGVEFVNMGQQGILGRYPLHFHVCGDTGNRSVVRRNAIYNSLQRCVVLHATDNVRVEGTVAFNTAGHCFLVEEGGERGNAFMGNLGMLTRRVTRKIPLDPANPAVSAETDDQPSTFWISNPTNTWVGNVAAGSEDSGFWFEVQTQVRGMSHLIPALQGIVPMTSPLGRFHGNVMHSNRMGGLRVYTSGYFPSRPAVFSGLRVYKHCQAGVALFTAANISLVGGQYADNQQGVFVQQASDTLVQGNTFVGPSANLGTPPTRRQCLDPGADWLCAPAQGCQWPVPADAPVRALDGLFHWKQSPTYGLAVAPSRSSQARPNRYLDNTFFNLGEGCGQTSAAVGVGLSKLPEDWWNPRTLFLRQGFRGLGTVPLWFLQGEGSLLGSFGRNPGLAGRHVVLRDGDGSFLGGGRAGFVLPLGQPALYPPPASQQGPSKCFNLTRLNAVGCPGACYRTLMVLYSEPGFQPTIEGLGPFVNRTRESYSWLRVTSTGDNAVLDSDGNLNKVHGRVEMTPDAFPARFYFVNLYAPAQYTVRVAPPTLNPGFKPDVVRYAYADGAGLCAAQLTLRWENAKSVQEDMAMALQRPPVSGLVTRIPAFIAT